MYRTFARTPEEVFNRHPHGATIRGLVGVMMCLNFLSFLSVSLRSLPLASRAISLPPITSLSLSLSLALSLPTPSLLYIHLSRRFYNPPRLRSTLFLLPSSRPARPFSTLNARTRARIHAHAAGPPLVVCRCASL